LAASDKTVLLREVVGEIHVERENRRFLATPEGGFSASGKTDDFSKRYEERYDPSGGREFIPGDEHRV
jgi:hypothetical protein